MSETTPGCNQNNAADHNSAVDSSPGKAGVDLAPVLISPSRILWRFELGFYTGLVGAASIALAPFFLAAFYWPVLWLMFLTAIGFVVRERWRYKNSPPVVLSVQKQVWRLKNIEGEFVVEPFGEIVLWSSVIIVPVREMLSGREHRIVILRDSVKMDDWRRLRVWLRTRLKNNI